jgi:hypothetical protein
VLEGEISKPLEYRLLVPVSALKSAKPPALGEEATQQRQDLDVLPQCCSRRQHAMWRPVQRRHTFHERYVSGRGLVCVHDRGGLLRMSRCSSVGQCLRTEEWVVEKIDYCEEKGWLVYYYTAGRPAPQMLGECEWPSACGLGAEVGLPY